MTMDVMEWLKGVRKLDGGLLEEMGVGPVDHPNLGTAVRLPYVKGGKPYAGKFRGVAEKSWRSSEGISRGLYNEDALDRFPDLPVVITEGEMDALSCVQAGWDRSVSLPDGWTEGGGKRDVLVDAEARLRRSPYVIAAGDNDEVGQGFPKALANILAGHDVRFVTWPEGCKDANDVLVKYGEVEIARCLNEAKQVDPEGGFITGISDLPPMPPRRVLRLGMHPYDFGLAFEVGAMSVGTGTPGSGKSTFTTFCAYHVAKHEDIKVGLLSFETHPYRTRDHLARLHCGEGYDQLDRLQKPRFLEFADAHFKIVHRTYEEGAHNLGWLRAMVYTLAVRDGCKLIVIDPWNELEHLPEPGESMTAYINFALQQIRTWAEKFDTHICVVAHPRKMPTDGKPRSPNGYDIADSAAFANKPSLGFTVHQEMAKTDTGDLTEWVRVTTWKVRDTVLYGFEKGSMRLDFLSETMAYRKYEETQAS